MTTYTPRELAEQLGYADEPRPGSVVRAYLRKKYPSHPKNQRWVLDESQAADVRESVARFAREAPDAGR